MKRVLIIVALLMIYQPFLFSQPGRQVNDTLLARLLRSGVDKQEATNYTDFIQKNKPFQPAAKQVTKSVNTVQSALNISAICNSTVSWDQYSTGISQGAGLFNTGFYMGTLSPVLLSTGAFPSAQYNFGCSPQVNWGTLQSGVVCNNQPAQPLVYELGFDPAVTGSINMSPHMGRLIRKTFHVDVQHCIFKYQYAFLSGGCVSFSEARVFDQNNNLVITKVHTNSNSSTVPVNCPGLIAPNGWPTCNASVPPPCGPGLPPSGGVPDPCFYQYLCSFPKLLKQFSVESIDLSPYYNQDVTIEFINSPCMTGQHLQYSLFGGFCFCKDCACTSWPSQISYNISPTAGTISSTGTIANNSSVVLPENMFLNFPAISAPCTGAGCQGNIVYELYSPTNSLIQAGNNGVDFSTVLKNQPCSNTGVYKLVIKGQCGTANCTTPFVVFISKPCSSTAMTVCGKPLCSADDTNTNSIILSVSGGTPPFTYLWSNGSILQNLTSVMPGQYSVTITDANGYKATASFNITCLPRCNFSQIAIPTKVITPGQSVMIGIAPEPGITYSWFSNPVGFTSSVANPTVSPVATTTYTLIRRNSNPGCPPKISTVLVTVN